MHFAAPVLEKHFISPGCNLIVSRRRWGQREYSRSQRSVHISFFFVYLCEALRLDFYDEKFWNLVSNTRTNAMNRGRVTQQQKRERLQYQKKNIIISLFFFYFREISSKQIVKKSISQANSTKSWEKKFAFVANNQLTLHFLF